MFQSVSLMTAIDLFVLGVTAYLIMLYIRHRESAARLGLATGLTAMLVGIGIVGCVYLADLITMTVMPSMVGEQSAMKIMREVHLQWSWVAAVLSTAAFAFGLHQLVGGLVPRLIASIDELRRVEHDLRENQALLERRVEERTAALTRTERQFRQFLDNSPDACHLKDVEGRYLFISRTYQDWLGVMTDAALGATFNDFVTDPELKDRAIQMDQRILDGERMVQESMEFEVQGRPPRSIEVRKFPVLDDHGQVALIGTISRDISDEMSRERALEESEARYALAAAGGTSGIWDWDLDAGRLHLSDRLRELLAFSDERATPVPDTILEVVHPDDRDRYTNTLKAHLRGETPVFSGEFRMVGDDGRVRWVMDRGMAQRDASGRVHRMAGSVLDITDEVEQRARTEEVERRLALALEHVQDGVALFDAEDRLVICNDTWRYQLNHVVAHLLVPGVSFETYVRALLDRAQIPDAIGREEEWLEGRLTQRRSGRNTVEIRMADDSWRLVRETVVEDGSLVLVATPITDRKRREIALERSEQRFRDLTEASSDWYWEMNEDLRFTYLSPGLEESTGVSERHFLGRRRHDTSGVSSDSSAWLDHLEDLDAHRPFRDFQYSIDLGTGATRHFRVSGVPVFAAQGRFSGYRGVGADVTVMVEAQRGRASAEERLSAAIESIDDTYAVFDDEDRLVICNQAYRRLYREAVGEALVLGTTFGEIIGAMVVNGAIAPAQEDPTGWIATRLAQHKEAASGYRQVVHNTGRWFQITETRTSFEDTVLVARDFTELKLHEQSLLDSERRLAAANQMFRLVLDSIPVRVFWKDLDGRYLGCSLSFAQDVGRQGVDELVGLVDSDLPWSDNAKRYRAEDEHVIETASAVSIPEESLELVGQVRWLRTTKVALRDLEEQVIGILGVYEDVTEARAAAAERDRLQLQLQAAVEQSPAGIVLTASPEPRLKVFNQAAVDILIPGDEVPRDMDWLERPPFPWVSLDENGAELPRDEVPLVHAERHGVVSRNVDMRVRLADGSEKQLLVNAGPVRDETGAVYGGVVVFVDVTEQRLAEAEVRRLNSELEARVEARTAALQNALHDLESFSYSVSHDLRAPLRHVKGYIDLLVKHASGGLDEKATRYLQVIDGAAERMGGLIDDLLEFSRTGRATIKRGPVDLREMVGQIRDELAMHSDRRIEWRIGELAALNADRGLIRQVMANLIGNAVKFTATRDRAVIEIGSAAEDGRPGSTVYFVRDNGVGYDTRYGDKLFGVFQRLHSHSEFEGTGIGLAIVHRIIARHGGRVWSDSGIEKGATFYFTVPMPESDAS